MTRNTAIRMLVLSVPVWLVVNLGASCPGTGINEPPVADAGADQAVASGATVTLDGSASLDPDGDALSHAWTQVPDTISVVLNNADTAIATFTAPSSPATLTFQLTVDDGHGHTATDTVTVATSMPGGTSLTFVKTAIGVRSDGGLIAGDDLIAFGTGATTGVSFLVPSLHPTAGTPVTNNASYASTGFAVGGKWIFLAGSSSGTIPLQVNVINTAKGNTVQTFSNTQIHLNSIPASQSSPGNMRADGSYCAMICNPTVVSDGLIVKVIDVSGSAPVLKAFTPNAVSSVANYKQVAVDSASKRVIVAARDSTDGKDKLYVYNITNTSAAPSIIVLPNGIDANTQMVILNGYVMALDAHSPPQAFLVNLTTQAIIPLTDSASTTGFAQAAAGCVRLGGSAFLYLAAAAAADTSGATHRVAVGTVPGPGSTKASLGQFINGSSASDGMIGFAQTAAIRPTGSFLFLSGTGSLGSGDYLQVSTGGVSFTVPPDPAGVSGGDPLGLPGTDVTASTNTVAFKTGTTVASGTNTTVGYAILP